MRIHAGVDAHLFGALAASADRKPAVAICYFDVKPVGRSAGRSATAAAAYRAGERIRDERTGAWHNYSRREDVLHKEILLPVRLQGTDMGWALDRARLWNTAEHAERRRNARVAREFQVALPHELSAVQRLELARAFSREVAERYNVAVDLAVHAPRPNGDQRNFHAHLLTTTREINAAGLGAKTGLDMRGDERRKRGLLGGIQELRAMRERWATLTNEALKAANLEVRVDHRTLLAQGIDREPRAPLPWAAYRAEQRGLRSEVAERVRELYRLRIQGRRQRAGARALGQHSALPPRPGGLAASPADRVSLEEVRRQARENWLQLRPPQRAVAAAANCDHSNKSAPEQQRAAKGSDDDFSL